MKKLSTVLLAVLMTTVIAAGCSTSSNTKSTDEGKSVSSTAASTSTTEKVKVSFWILDSQDMLEKATEDFTKANPNITVNVSKYGVDPIKEALKVAANSKTLPNIWFSWGGSLGSFYPENGLTQDLTQIAAEHKWSSIYNQSAIDMGTFGGKISGIPYHLNALDVWYNKEVYTKMKLNPPTSFEEFEAQLKQLKDGGVVPLALGGKNGWHIMRLTEQLLEHFAGPQLHDQLNSLSASWNNPAVVQTFAKIKEYTDKGYFPKGHVAVDNNEAINLYYAGKSAMSIEGTWLDGAITSGGFKTENYDVFKFPTGRSSVFAEMFLLKAGMDQATLDATIKLGEYLTSKEVVEKYIDTYGTPAKLGVNFTDKTPHVKPLLDMAGKGGFLIMDQALPQEVVQKLFAAQDKVALGEWTPQQAAEEMEKSAVAFKNKK